VAFRRLRPGDRLATLPDVGPVTANAMVATVGDATRFTSASSDWEPFETDFTIDLVNFVRATEIVQQTRKAAMQVKALTPTFGAEITGISLADGLPDEEYRALQRAFLTYSVIVIKRQQLTTRQLVAFGERFGRIRPHPLVRRQHPDCPKVTVLASEPIDEKSQTDREGVERGSDWEIDLVGWHTDLAYEQVAAMATVVLSQEVPRVGGDMRFVSAYLAYDALPPALKERIEGRVGTFCYGGRKAWKLRHLNDGQPQLPIVEHPAILIHPETGRKALYVNPHHSLGFANMPQ
jgi:taurine dioxygenase